MIMADTGLCIQEEHSLTLKITEGANITQASLIFRE